MPNHKSSAKVRPLLPRPGARYTCFGDGLCCTDLHGLGPLTRGETKALRVISHEVIAYPSETEFEEPMLRTSEDGGCLFLGPSGCELHYTLGADAKPDGCRRYPLGLAATPAGGRITTRHRCTCRTLGDRPELDPDAVAPSLMTGGRLKADRKIGDRIRWTERGRIGFAKYTRREEELLARLESGVDPLEVLDASPFPPLKDTSWKHETDEMVHRGADDSRFGVAIEWFARSVKALLRLPTPKVVRPLRWSESFARALARSPEVGDPQRVLADWVADEIWGLQWTELGSFERARYDLATRYRVAMDLKDRLALEGRRPDAAAAEAVTIVDLMGDSEWWDDVVVAMDLRRARPS